MDSPVTPRGALAPNDMALVLDALHDAVLALDGSGRVLHANAAAGQLLQCAPALLAGLRLDAVLAAAGAASPGGDGAADGHWTLHLQDPDGAPVPVAATRVVVQPGSGIAQVLVLQDQRPQLEARHAREEQLAAERANQAKSEFLSHVSHELRTPLNAVLGFAQILRLDGRHPLDAHQRGHVDQIEQAGWHLLRLIEQVLDLTRVESGRVTLGLEPVQVAGVTDEAIALVAPQAEQRDITLRRGSCVGLAAVMADRIRLRQVLLNLLSNAVKYNKDGGAIDVGVVARTSADGRAGVEWSVSDTGEGLSEAQQARLFNAFERLGRERSGIEGLGIGLVIARRFVEEMRGHVGVCSAVGHGTTFTVWLPLAAAVPPP